MRLGWWLAAGWLGTFAASGHGDVHARIEGMSQRIATSPADARLYLQRAELFRQHEQWQAAFADCDKAEQLDPAIDAALLRGRCLLEAARPADALPVLDGYLGRHPQHTQAWVCRARVLTRLKRHAAAIADYREALQRSPRPEPDLVQECADALAALGKISEAVQVLDDGLAKLGAVPSLALHAMDIEAAAGNFVAALARVETLRKAAPRPEPWMAKRASLLAQAGRMQESQAAWQALVGHLSALPALERRSHAMSQLLEQARQALAALDSVRPANEPPPIAPPASKS
ncbi:MAG: tetratricopeptide repeat protein [Verrucomicrobiota bacterium]